jgi:RND family efflux transporter MFP subunit
MKRLSVWFGLLITCMTFPATAADVEALVQWSRRTELAAPVSGVVASVAVNAGERAAKGQLLLALDDEPFRAAVQEAEALLARRKSERDEAARDAKQAQELYDRTVLSTVELENAKMKLARADAGYKQANAMLDRARYRLRVSALRAPFDAVVLSRHAEPGQAIAAELKPPVLLVIAAAGEYIAQARVSAERVAGLKVGQALSVVAGGKTYTAQLKALAHEPAGGKELYVLEAVFTAQEQLYAGQTARIQLP